MADVTTSVAAQGLRSLTMTAGQDLIGGLLKADLWGRLGWLDVKRRYRRTSIGPFWSSISLAIYVVAVGIAGAGLWHQDIRDYLPFLVTGLIGWMLVATTISEACTLLVSGHALFRNVAFEYSILAYALVWRNFIVFLHNLVVYALVVGILRPSLVGPAVLLALPGLILVTLNGVWIALLCGIFCLRFRDITLIVANFLQIAMFVTPIFWPPDSLVGIHRLIFVETNPLYHLVDVLRAPLLGRIPSMTSYAIVLTITMIGWLLMYRVFRHFRKRIAYWS